MAILSACFAWQDAIITFAGYFLNLQSINLQVMLSKKDFTLIVKNTPLVSIDLIIENAEGKVLLGYRSNQPAKGYWFVPGGRIRKDELFAAAFSRIFQAETGQTTEIEKAEFLGVYEHLYPGDNFAGEADVSTHYIVIAYRIVPGGSLKNLPEEQHSAYRWASPSEILEDPEVHMNTKNYFNGHPSFSDSR